MIRQFGLQSTGVSEALYMAVGCHASQSISTRIHTTAFKYRSLSEFARRSDKFPKYLEFFDPIKQTVVDSP